MKKTLKHDYFNNINRAYRFTIFQLDTWPFCFLFFFVIMSFYPHTIHKTSKLWFLPNSPQLLPPTCLPCLALTHKKQSFRTSPKIIVQQLVILCIKLIITKQIMELVTFWKKRPSSCNWHSNPIKELLYDIKVLEKFPKCIWKAPYVHEFIPLRKRGGILDLLFKSEGISNNSQNSLSLLVSRYKIPLPLMPHDIKV
jgi:hypothetical protein